MPKKFSNLTNPRKQSKQLKPLKIKQEKNVLKSMLWKTKHTGLVLAYWDHFFCKKLTYIGPCLTLQTDHHILPSLSLSRSLVFDPQDTHTNSSNKEIKRIKSNGIMKDLSYLTLVDLFLRLWLNYFFFLCPLFFHFHKTITFVSYNNKKIMKYVKVA